MRFLADEYIPGSVIAELRNRGHDVLSAKESLRGEDDAAVLSHAQADSRVVITRDKDFGELAFHFGLPSACGVILFRLPTADRDVSVQRIVDVVESRRNWEGMFAVANERRIRVRPLPTAGMP